MFAAYERSLSEADKCLDVMFDEQGAVWLAGIPRKGDMSRLTALLREAGHVAHTTEAPRRL